MITLKQLLAYQELTRKTDLDIIQEWFIVNNMESEGLSIIPKLAKAQYEKIEKVLLNARAWIPVLPDLEKSNNGLDKKTAKALEKIIITYLLGMKLEQSDYYDWAKKEIPKMKTPKIIFVPCVEWLEKEYGIKFKGE